MEPRLNTHRSLLCKVLSVQNVVFAEVRLENRRALTGGRTEHFITKEVRPVVTCIRIADKEHFSSCNREL